MNTFITKAKGISRFLGLDGRAIYQRLSSASLRAAWREQGLGDLVDTLRNVQPDISSQYTDMPPAEEYSSYWEPKMRGLHAFQTRSALESLALIGKLDGVDLVDYGDSSGTHLAYLRALAPRGSIKSALSVNADPVAVEKIRARGGEARLGNARDGFPDMVDLVLILQTLEHVPDPLGFLRSLFLGGTGAVLVTVPYMRQGRFGGASLRRAAAGGAGRLTIEDAHLWELSPDDWALLCRLGGFSQQRTWTYRQYPKRHPLRLTKPLWRALDFEGFHAIYAVRDTTLIERYEGWL